MGNAETYDEDAVLRARVLLLGSERPGWWEEVAAYRVLATVSPAAYLPKLVGALTSYRLNHWRGADPDVELAFLTEAVDAARRIGADEPNRDRTLGDTLLSYQRALFAAGRRAEGRAACEELAEAGRHGRLAVVLTEEGRHEEAAELHRRSSRVERAAALQAAGRLTEAVDAFSERVDDTREQAEQGEAQPADLVCELVHRSRMLDAAGRPTEAAADRREAEGVLRRLTETGELTTRSSKLSSWATLFALSDRAAEPTGTPDAPAPPLGADFHDWSRDTQASYLDAIPALEAETARLVEAGRLPEALTAQRRTTTRTSIQRERGHRHRFTEELLPRFDEGVSLARRLPGDPTALARALTDRSLFLAVVRRYGEAHADLMEAVALHNDPPIVTRT